MKPFPTYRLMLALFLTAAAANAASVGFTIQLGSQAPASAGLSPYQILHGSASYDATLVPTVGSAMLNRVIDETLTINLNFAGDLYTQADDNEYPDFPQFYFQDGWLVAMSYYSENKYAASDADGFLQIEGFPQIFTYSFNGDEEFNGTVSWQPRPVPEPAAALFGGLAALTILKRRRVLPY